MGKFHKYTLFGTTFYFYHHFRDIFTNTTFINEKKTILPLLIFFSIVDSSSLYHLSTSPSLTSLLANLAVLVDQLKLNRLFSYRYTDDDNTTASDCIVVCLHSREEKK
ncbi:hypothetical protein Bca4012_058942 [Brassica carinata]